MITQVINNGISQVIIDYNHEGLQRGYERREKRNERKLTIGRAEVKDLFKGCSLKLVNLEKINLTLIINFTLFKLTR